MKYRHREPLILSGHGVRIRVDHNTLLIRSGFTHYPQKPEEIRLFPGDPNIPDRIILLDASGGISFDALGWMSDQEIAFIQIDWRGRVKFSGDSGFSANPKLVRRQSEIWGSEKALQINRKLIAAKCEACEETLSAIFAKSEKSLKAISQIRLYKNKVLNSKDANSHGRILGFEGMAAWNYYKTWHELPLKWAGLWKKPIPASWFRIGSRSMSWQRESNNARHPINAMLNYGYAILISSVRSELVAVGFDPSIGIAHRRQSNPIPLVYDLMEPLRPIIDLAVLRFAMSHIFTPGDFTINNSGGCRLNPQLAKALSADISNLRPKAEIERFIGFF